MTHEQVLARLGRAAHVFPPLRHVGKRCVLYPAKERYHFWVYCFDGGDRVVLARRGSSITGGPKEGF
jgi:hypothetical protein